jgi:acyl-CoA synthetase (AMP-forming)/AMP-acid ligase II
MADKVAMYLLSHSKKCDYLSPTWLEDTFVAHLFPRCAESYIAMLGILKSGAAYVPLDPAFPMDRIAYILQDCKAKFIITTVEIGIRLKKYLNDMKRNGQDIATEVLFWEDIDTGNSRTTDYLTVMDLEFRSRARINANSACYVIYTSGIA